MKKAASLLLVLCMVMSLAACGSPSSESAGTQAQAVTEAAPKGEEIEAEEIEAVAVSDTVGVGEVEEGGTLVIWQSGNPTMWNPDYKSDDYLWPIAQNIYSRLVKLTAYDGIDMDLAESYEFSEDGTDLTFHLKQNVLWHDGEPFTSYDVKWTYDTVIGESWFKSTSLEAVESIECPDDYTVVMHLNAPDVTVVPKLAWYGLFILPAHIFEGTDYSTNEAQTSHPIGTGPFRFDSFESDVSVTLVKNEDYFDGEPVLDRMIYSIITDEDTAYQAFLNGEIDYFDGGVPKANVGDLSDDPDFRTITKLYQNRTYITFNFDDPDFSKTEVRQALAYAVDRRGIYDRVGAGGAKAEYFITPLQEDFVDPNYTMPERDVDYAMELLESAGYEKDEDGYYLHTTIDCFESGNFADVAQIVKANLDEAGIDLSINMMEYAAWQDKVIANKDFSVTMLAGYQGPDISGVAARIQTGGSTNYGGYSNPELDEALIASNSCSDVSERAAYYSTVQRIMSEDMPMVFLLENGSEIPIRNTLLNSPYDLPDLMASSELTYLGWAK